MGRLLVVAGLLLTGVGLLVMMGVPFGRLPGDIVIRRGGMTIYLPMGTSILVSVALTLLLTVLRR